MSKPERPVLTIPQTPVEVLLDRLSLVGLLVIVAILTGAWGDLPQRVPTHFGASGAPDGWGSKTSLLLFPAVALALHIGLSILARYPHIYNYPTAVTAENAERLYRAGRGLIVWLRTEIVWLFAVLGWLMIRASLGQVEGLDPLAVWIGIGVIYGTVAVFIVAMFRAKKARPADGVA